MPDNAWSIFEATAAARHEVTDETQEDCERSLFRAILSSSPHYDEIVDERRKEAIEQW